MEINIRLHGLLRRYAKEDGKVTLKMPKGITIQDVVDELKIPRGLCAVITANGKAVTPNVKLEGEKVELVIYPFVSGG
jgi:sulfur carrier protein ThiS